jgi:hypothetical protein
MRRAKKIKICVRKSLVLVLLVTSVITEVSTQIVSNGGTGYEPDHVQCS